MNILWLPSWYPSKIDRFNGDFVQRHARAASLYHSIFVLHVIKDAQGSLTNNVLVEEITEGRLTERIVYYRHRFGHLPVLGRLFSFLKSQSLYRQQLRLVLAQKGKPDLVHVHVALRAGLVALWLKRRYRLRYLVSEHASIFLPEAPDYIGRHRWNHQLAIRVFQQASGVSAVSVYLGKALQGFFSKMPVRIVPNVVDTDIFKPALPLKKNGLRFLHVSGLGFEKNPECLLQAFALLAKQVADFRLDIVGPTKNDLVQKVGELHLKDKVCFHAEMPQPGIAALMQKADALVLPSRYETFGCVVIEAHACGKPVIAADIPSLRETIVDGTNGLFAQPDDAQSLCSKLLLFIQRQDGFDGEKIARRAKENYSFAAVGEQISQWYAETVQQPSR